MSNYPKNPVPPHERIEPIDWALCALCVLKLIPVDFARLVPGGIDFRNILYLYAAFVLYPNVNAVIHGIRGPAMGLLGSLGAYSALVIGMKFSYGKPLLLTDLYGSVWSLWLVFLLLWRGRSWRRLDLFLKTTLVTVAVSGAYGLLMLVSREPFWSLRAALLGRPHDLVAGSHEQLIGLCAKVFTFGYEIAALGVGAFVCLSFAEKGRAKAKWTFLTAVGLATLFFNAERSAALAVVTMSGLFLLAYGRGSRNAGFMIAAICAICVAWPFMPELKLAESDERATLSERFRGEQAPRDIRIRWRMQVAGLKATLQSPYGSAESAYKDQIKEDPVLIETFPNLRRIPAPHNHFINVGFTNGWMGTLIMFVFFAFAWSCKRRVRRTLMFMRRRTLLSDNLLVVLFSLGAVFVNSCFHNDGIFSGNGISLILVGLLGAASTMPPPPWEEPELPERREQPTREKPPIA